jgi:hypothetical protein
MLKNKKLREIAFGAVSLNFTLEKKNKKNKNLLKLLYKNIFI